MNYLNIFNPQTTSVLGIAMRLIATVYLLAVIRAQIQAFQNRSNVQRLKKLLLALAMTLLASNVFPLLTNYSRINDGKSTAILVSLATLSNAATVLIAAIMLHLIYKFKVKE